MKMILKHSNTLTDRRNGKCGGKTLRVLGGATGAHRHQPDPDIYSDKHFHQKGGFTFGSTPQQGWSPH